MFTLPENWHNIRTTDLQVDNIAMKKNYHRSFCPILLNTACEIIHWSHTVAKNVLEKFDNFEYDDVGDVEVSVTDAVMLLNVLETNFPYRVK